MRNSPIAAALVFTFAALPAHADDAFPQEGAPLPLTSNDPQLGPRDAPLTVVALADLDPSTARFTSQTLDLLWPALEKRYKKKVRLVFAHVAGDTPAGRSSSEASIGVWTTTPKAWPAFIRELSAFKGTLDANALAGLAALSGVKSRDRFVADLTAGRWRVALEEGIAARANANKGARYGQVRVNGQLLQVSLEDPSTTFWHLDRELAATEAARKRGVKARDLYGYRTSQNFANPVLAGVRTAWKDATGPDTPRSPTITGTSIGPFKLGMTRAEFDALDLLTEDRSSGWTCVSVEAPNKGRCSYSLRFDKGRLQIAEYNPGVANDGFRVKGKHVTRDVTMDEAIAALGCGDWAAAEGASWVKCGETLFLTLGSGNPKEGRPFSRLSSADPTDKVSYSPFTLRLDAGWER